ncbi:MAG: hypothetical protein JWO46_423 [Nocardioidaceae bacterium]|nr:hypothetical protein [Nocardioidaceae bacterium]
MSRQIQVEQGVPRLVEAAAVPLAADAVRVKVSRAGVNFWEVMQLRGKVPLPANGVPGSEGSGVILEVGPAVTGLASGTRVAWSKVPGSYADEVVGPATSFVAVPADVGDDTAAALLFQGLTAAYLAHETWPTRPGDVAVVTAAAGGVGVLLTQHLVASGASVIGAVSSAHKVAAAQEAGASHVLLYGDTLADDVRALAPGGVAVVYDAVGAGVAEPLIATLRPRGALVLYGSASGQEADVSARDLGAGSYFLTRTAGRDYLGDAEQVRSASARLLDLAAAGTLRPLVGATYALADVQHAWDDLGSRASVGKLLLTLADPA